MSYLKFALAALMTVAVAVGIGSVAGSMVVAKIEQSMIARGCK